MREAIAARMGQLREELQRADEEAGKLRPRLQYLEQMMLRLDGALTAMQGLLDETRLPPEAAPAPGPDARIATSLPWETVAP